MERVTWLGHAAVLIETGGVVLITDPVLRGRVAHLRRHPPLPPLPQHLDAVLISHLHRDHFDVPTLRRLDGGAPLAVPGGTGAAFAVRHLGRRVHELAAGEVLEVGGVRVRAVPAVHDVRRMPLGTLTPAVGFVVEGPRRVYFAGDTELFAGMAHLADRLDVALLPVWGWGPRLGPGHMDPDAAARAAALLRPAVAIPIHWATLWPIGRDHRRRGLLRTPGATFAARVRAWAPDVRPVVLAPGEELAL